MSAATPTNGASRRDPIATASKRIVAEESEPASMMSRSESPRSPTVTYKARTRAGVKRLSLDGEVDHPDEPSSPPPVARRREDDDVTASTAITTIRKSSRTSSKRAAIVLAHDIDPDEDDEEWMPAKQPRASSNVAPARSDEEDVQTTASTRKRKAAKKRPPRTNEPLPLPDCLAIIVSYVSDAYALASIAMSCKTGFAIVRALPKARSLLLDGGAEKLENHPLEICRALSILAFRRCEICGKRSAKSFNAPFYIFAHLKCMESAVLTSLDLAKKSYDFRQLTTILRRFEAPLIITERRTRFGIERVARYIKQPLGPRFVPDYWTVAGVRALVSSKQLTERRMTEIVAEVEARRGEDVWIREETREAVQERADLAARAALHRAEVAEMDEIQREVWMEQATRNRLVDLDLALARASLPPVANIVDLVGRRAVDDALGGGWDVPRLFPPPGWSDCVARLAHLLLQ